MSVAERVQAGHEFTEPSSLEDAQRRDHALLFNIQEIQKQLGEGRTDLSEGQLRDWRRRARSAINYKQAERRFLKIWIHAQHQKSNGSATPRAIVDMKTIELAAILAGRVKRLERLYESVVALIADDTDEAWELVVERAESVSRDEPTSGESDACPHDPDGLHHQGCGCDV